MLNIVIFIRHIAEEHLIAGRDVINFALFFNNELTYIQDKFQKNTSFLRDVVRFSAEERTHLNVTSENIQKIQKSIQNQANPSLLHEYIIAATTGLDQHLNTQLKSNRSIATGFKQDITKQVFALEHVLDQMYTRTTDELYANFLVFTNTVIDSVTNYRNNIPQANALLQRFDHEIEISLDNETRDQLVQTRLVLQANIHAAIE
ncbi:uncharacterized protein EV154DRAFT_487132 [Mucor mucedo]|uniref:uncharacterized protein n=1 Tax=Mucor mucedo TaxID=29922 RepID=UPI00221F5C89|nr:uncharacterized protein EV154DRAFT_487132 [Mucor mucedo]KAI7873566.1 hypothetical protein EV154DRAFT_487132 [Mucor mucedo]